MRVPESLYFGNLGEILLRCVCPPFPHKQERQDRDAWPWCCVYVMWTDFLVVYYL